MIDAVKKYAGVDWNEVSTLEEARALADKHHVEYEDRHKKGDILSLFFEEFAEEHLIQRHSLWTIRSRSPRSPRKSRKIRTM